MSCKRRKTVEAAGIEPASHPSPNGSSSRGFEHWKLDGKIAQDAVDRGEAYWLEEPVPSGRFSAKTTICGIDFEVRRDGKHANLHLHTHNDEGLPFIWTFEPLETVIPKLEAFLGAARLVANSEYDRDSPNCKELGLCECAELPEHCQCQV